LGPTPTPTVSPLPAERITFAPGQDSAMRSGPLARNQYKRYIFSGMAGQTATIVVSSPSPSTFFTVVGVTDGIPYKSQGSSAMSFTFTLPLTQDYLISLAATVNTSYNLVLTIPPLASPTTTPTTSPTDSPTATATPTLLPTVVPPTATPTETPTGVPTVPPPTATPTETPTVLPTVVPPTATPEPPTATPTAEPPTATPEPPTPIPTVEPPTATPEPPTATPEPPTATP
jgi:hypothetical protein